MTIWPLTSARSTVPVADIKRLTSSITSTKASFLRYLISERRQESAPVACMVMRLESVGLLTMADLTPSVVMYIFRVSVSVFWGYPKSRISGSYLLALCPHCLSALLFLESLLPCHLRPTTRMHSYTIAHKKTM